MEDHPLLLRAMLADQKAQPPQYRPGPYWQGYSRRITHALERDGLADFRANYTISKGLADAPLLDPASLWRGRGWKKALLRRLATSRPLRQTLVEPYLRAIRHQYEQARYYRNLHCRSELGEWLSAGPLVGEDRIETMAGGCRDFVEFDGVLISTTYLRQLIWIHNFSQNLDLGDIRSVTEVGGGFGANAHLLLETKPNIRKYVYLDLPPMLYVGTQYLRHFYGDSVRDYLTTRTADPIRFQENDDREILAICPWQLERLEAEVDLLWNSASFQEIEPFAISNYLSKLSSLGGQGHLCLVIYRDGTPEKTLTVEEVAELAGEYFVMSEVEPLIEGPWPPRQLLGSRRTLRVGATSGRAGSQRGAATGDRRSIARDTDESSLVLRRD